MYLGKILELTFTQPSFLSKVPDNSAGALGQAYLNLLDIVNEPKFYQTLSTLGYYYLSCGLSYDSGDYNLLDKRILILNLGAQTFCRTIAKATGLFLPNYIDFNNWENFPEAVKYVLMLEYCDFEKLQRMVSLPRDMFVRKQWLDSAVASGYFKDICPVNEILDFTWALHNKVLEYLNTILR